MNFLKIIICGFLLGISSHLSLQATQSNPSERAIDTPRMKYENGRFIMENLPDEISEEGNNKWINEVLTTFGIEPSQADVQYGDHSFSFKIPSGFCPCSQSKRP